MEGLSNRRGVPGVPGEEIGEFNRPPRLGASARQARWTQMPGGSERDCAAEASPATRPTDSGWQEDERWLHSAFRMKSNSRRAPRFIPRMRVLRGKEVALGPGKAELLALI